MSFEYIIKDILILNENKKELIINILNRSADISTIFEGISNINEYYQVTIKLTFLYNKNVIIPEDISEDIYVETIDEKYILDLLNVTKSEEITKLIIEGDPIDRLQIKFRIDNLDSGQINKLFPNLTYFELRNCDILNDFIMYDRDAILIVYDNCTFSNYSLIFAKTASPVRNSNMHIKIKDCIFNLCKEVILGGCKGVVFSNNKIINNNIIKADESETDMGNVLGTTLKFYDNEDLTIQFLNIINMKNIVEIYNNTSVNISFITASFIDKYSPLQDTFKIYDNLLVKINNFNLNGLLIINCNEVTVANVIVNDTICGNAEYGIKALNIQEKLSIAKVEIKNVCKIGIRLAILKSIVAISSADLFGLKVGIDAENLMGNSSISSSNITECTLAGVRAKALENSIMITDSFIFNNKINIDIRVGTIVNFVNTMITNSNIFGSKPDIENKDLIIIDISEFRMNNCNLNKSFLSLSNTINYYFDYNTIRDSYFSINGGNLCELRNNYFDIGAVPFYEKTKPIEISNILKVVLLGNELINQTPLIFGIDTIEITDNKLDAGIKLVSCGDSKSIINKNRIGKEDSKYYKNGIILLECRSLTIEENDFTVPTDSVILEAMKSNYIIFMNTNKYTNKGTKILVPDHDGINVNHIALETNSELNPKVESTSMFRECLFLFDKKAFIALGYTESKLVKTTDDLKAANINIVSFLNYSEENATKTLRKINNYIKSLSRETDNILNSSEA